MLDDNIVCLTILLGRVDLLVHGPGADGLANQVAELGHTGDVGVLRVVGVDDADEVFLCQDLEEV